MRGLIVAGIVLLGSGLPSRGASYYPVRLDDPKAVYLTQDQFLVPHETPPTKPTTRPQSSLDATGTEVRGQVSGGSNQGARQGTASENQLCAAALTVFRLR